MADKEAILRKQERAATKALEYARKAQAAKKALSAIDRKEDTRRKILAGSWALDRAAKSEEFAAAMRRDLGRAWLVRDDDRKLFGFEPLTDAEKERRGVGRAAGAAGTSPAGSVIEGAFSDGREVENSPAEDRETEAA